MKRLVIGGPEEYDDTFVEWPDGYDTYKVLIPQKASIFDYNYMDSARDIHTYRLQRIMLANGEDIISVWLSVDRKFDEPIETRYNYNLLGCTDKWQRYYSQDKMKYVYEYYCFGKWHSYWEISNEALYRFAGQRFLYFDWLIQELLKARSEMRFYKVERVDQTAKIGSSSS